MKSEKDVTEVLNKRKTLNLLKVVDSSCIKSPLKHNTGSPGERFEESLPGYCHEE